jgi:magnesium chelatase family protein
VADWRASAPMPATRASGAVDFADVQRPAAARAPRWRSPSPAATTWLAHRPARHRQDHAGAPRARRILPSLPLPLALETKLIYSAAGLSDGLALQRPFRAPHHTISVAGLLGGGATPRPGEISLAHGGVLFLDELPEFQRMAIEGCGSRSRSARSSARASPRE